ncbi:HD family phosphohydrolase [Clostridia bacterium]|nr:HD family phosphohydrolase [Clostridia bacterium]GHU73767.1 HD family phosphohydrolase [Clostridia bacterium]
MAEYVDFIELLGADGNVCAHDVVGTDGRKLLTKGTVLNQYYINRLLRFNIRKIWVVKEITKNYKSNEDVDADISNSILTIMNNIMANRAVPVEYRDRLFNILYYSNPDNFASIVMYVEYIGNVDDFSYNHSLSVTWISIKIGHLYGLKTEQLYDLMQAALLHDIGKVNIPKNVIDKQGNLGSRDLEVIRRHPLIGCRMIKELVKQDISDAVLYHHEKLNGTGYPFGLLEPDIPIYAQIIAIADIFEAMTANRPYRKGLPLFSAIKLLRDMAFSNEISYKLYEIFENNLMNSFIGKPHPTIPNAFVVGYDKEKIELLYLNE